MKLSINGDVHDLPELDAHPTMARLVELLHMKPDRIAVERNGDIVPRSTWNQVAVAEGDKLEVVQFVGGGLD